MPDRQTRVVWEVSTSRSAAQNMFRHHNLILLHLQMTCCFYSLELPSTRTYLNLSTILWSGSAGDDDSSSFLSTKDSIMHKVCICLVSFYPELIQFYFSKATKMDLIDSILFKIDKFFIQFLK
jgi:hypothetical protein